MNLNVRVTYENTFKIIRRYNNDAYYIRLELLYYFEKIRFRLIGSFVIINDHFNRENGNSRV